MRTSHNHNSEPKHLSSLINLVGDEYAMFRHSVREKSVLVSQRNADFLENNATLSEASAEPATNRQKGQSGGRER